MMEEFPQNAKKVGIKFRGILCLDFLVKQKNHFSNDKLGKEIGHHRLSVFTGAAPSWYTFL